MDNPFKPVHSSLIAGYTYDPNGQKLTVCFATDPDTEHIYAPVKAETVQAVFEQSQSIGSSFIKQIQRDRNVRHSLETE